MHLPPPRQQLLLRQLAGAVRAHGLAAHDGGAALPPEDELAALVGPLFADEPATILLAALDAARPDPSTSWRRQPELPDDLRRLLGASLPPSPPRPLDRDDLLFLFAARAVAAPSPAARPTLLPPAVRTAVTAHLGDLGEPPGALAALLGFVPFVPRRLDTVLGPDRERYVIDFDHLLGVERRALPRRGVLGRVPGLKSVGARCVAARCRTLLPAWLPRCHGCGRPVRGEGGQPGRW